MIYINYDDGTKWERDFAETRYTGDGVWITSFHKLGTAGNLEQHKDLFFNDNEVDGEYWCWN